MERPIAVGEGKDQPFKRAENEEIFDCCYQFQNPGPLSRPKGFVIIIFL
ncbi:hypothetical protein [Rufibacter quisquiliarum]|uniref:Uncharacterized protein n=1 Tax=Rufibacter quisquiliarum TaxID=1549639 RepID=A0A839GHS4_9BACT|nr:hypothetical protein [Rufibacter quisquiliarum]MBA9079204.1 hypothetical protein [Rufibacter quisquiliarum]